MDEQPITIEEALVKKKRKWPTMLVVLVVAVLVGGLTYYFVNKKATADKSNLQTQIDDLNKKVVDTQSLLTVAKNAASTAKSTSASSMTTTTTSTTSTSWKNYSNTAYGFSFIFPNDYWKDYTVVAQTPTTDDSTKSIYFCLSSTDKAWNDNICAKGSGSPLAIGVYTKAQWAVVASQDTPESQMKIGENASHVFTMSHWQDGPADLTALNLGFDAISASFRVN